MNDLKKAALPKENKGVLLLNLGSPQKPTAISVYRYLREFLKDPFVIDIHPVARFLLVELIIVPTRCFSSKKAYQSVWRKEGSPLVYFTKNFTQKLAKEFTDKLWVDFAMRYQKPSIREKLIEIQKLNLDEVLVLPLYPQYAESSSRTAIDETKKQAQKIGLKTKLRFIDFFYNEPLYQEALTQKIDNELKNFNYDHLLFSYHGLPERHLKKIDPTQSYCLIQKNCCHQITNANRYCYKAHCFQTTKAVVQSLEIANGKYSMSFQSRLGKTPWISPFTDQKIIELAQKGIKNLAIVCPSFVADCLETLEEIGIRAREDFLKNGGKTLKLIPCLNDDDAWVKKASQIILEKF